MGLGCVLRRGLVAMLGAALVWSGMAVAQPGGSPNAPPATPPPVRAAPAADPVDADVTSEQVKALRERLEAGELTGAPHDLAAAALVAADAALAQQVEFQAAIARFQQEIDGAPAALEANRVALAAPAPDPGAEIPAEAGLEALEQLLTQARAQLEAARGQLTVTEGEPAVRQKRREAIPAELAEAQRLREEAEAAVAAPEAADTPPLVAESRLVRDRAAAQAARTRAQALQRELASIEARRENLQARLDVARRALAERDALVKEIERRVAEARRLASQRAEAAARQALLAAAGSHPRVQEVLRSTQALASRLATDPLTQELGAQELAGVAATQADAASQSLASLRTDYRSTMERVEAVGLTDTMGRLLREKRRRLESPLELREQIRQDRNTRSAILLELFELRPLESEWGQPEQVARAVAEAETTLSSEERVALAAQLQAALIKRLDVYRLLVDVLEAYQTSLGQLDKLNQARLSLLVSYTEEIDRTILWVPSHHPAGASDLDEIGSGLAWISDGEAWDRALRGPGGFLDRVRDRPISTLGPLLVVLVLALVARPAMSRATDSLHERARRVGTDSFRLTMRALVLATVISAIPSGFLLALYGMLESVGDVADQPRAVGMGCLTAAGLLFVMTLVRRLTRRGGLAEVHFRWSEEVTGAIRSKLRWLLPLALATHPLISAVTLNPDTPGGPALARVALVVWLGALALALYRLLRPRGPALSHFLRISPGGWVDRLRWVWYPTAFGAPLALGVIALLGYIETARELEARFLDTIGLVLGLILVSALVMRWISLARRRVAMEAARRRREARDAELAKELGAAEGSAPPPEADQGANLEEIDTQTRQLLRFGVGLSTIFGIWAIWVGVLPALGMLERVELWPKLRIAPQSQRPLIATGLGEPVPASASRSSPTAVPAGASGGATNGAPASGAPAAASPAAPATNGATAMMPGGGPVAPTAAPTGEAAGEAGSSAFTVADLLIFFVLAVATMVAARNLPGVVEILLLQHLPLDRGARYAVTTVFRYTILIIGVSATLNAVGIGWGKVQWLAAALTFGLGFGLQEIFANFVSGLIILAERPVRIGDTVTVNNVTGNVSKIRMRATTIVDYDKRELVVPNRLFITDSVINWTLSDPTTRIVIPVGVAYGSDINLVRETLLRVGRASSYIMGGREPVALFRAFGDSSLNFELRVWARNVDEAHLAKDELLRGVDRAFREAKIEIPFPQRDVWVRGIPTPPAAAPPPAGGSPTHSV